jgi:hypothetical protein
MKEIFSFTNRGIRFFPNSRNTMSKNVSLGFIGEKDIIAAYI